MEYKIRPAESTDMPEMLRLWREMMDFHAQVEPRFRPAPSPQGEEAMAKHIRDDVWASNDWCTLVAQQGDRLVGQIFGNVRENYAVFLPARYGYVTDIVVDPAVRRQGVGRELFAALQDWFRDRGAEYVQLQVAYNNPGSQAFWRGLGFTDYLDNLWCDLEGR